MHVFPLILLLLGTVLYRHLFLRGSSASPDLSNDCSLNALSTDNHLSAPHNPPQSTSDLGKLQKFDDNILSLIASCSGPALRATNKAFSRLGLLPLNKVSTTAIHQQRGIPKLCQSRCCVSEKSQTQFRHRFRQLCSRRALPRHSRQPCGES